MARTVQRFGWVRDLPDHRDRRFDHARALTAIPLPESVDLRQSGHLDFEIYDQGALGSCTANAISAAVRFEEMKQGLPEVDPSRLFIYYEERAVEGSTDTDSGAQIRDGLKVVANVGYPSESLWPYDVAEFAVKPPSAVYDAAHRDRVTSYFRVDVDAIALKTCLAAGYPVVVGFTVYESFQSPHVAATGDAPMPGPDESVLGGHAVLVVGYDPDKWIVRNSWGTGWGSGGYFTLPKAYLADPSLASDFWTLRAETER